MLNDRSAALLNSWLTKTLIAVALFIGTVALFWPARSYDFIDYDDPLYVTENPTVQKGLTFEGLKYAFATGDASNWHPVTWLSHMADCELSARPPRHEERGGKRVVTFDPKVHHTTSIVLHGVNAALFSLVLCSLIPGRIVACAFVAALFAVHPLRIESVVWIAERKDILSALFGLLAIWSYASFARRGAGWGGWWKYALVTICFALSLMSKPMLVTLPFVLLLLDFWPLKRIGRVEETSGQPAWLVDESSGPGWSWPIARRLILEKLPLLGLTIALCAVTIIVQREGGSMESASQLPLSERLGNGAISYMRYLGATFWPVDLAVLYPYPKWQTGIVLASLGGIIAISIAALATAKRYPAFVVGWLWFLGTLVPVIGIVQVGVQSMADRYTYVPHMGLIIAIVFTLTTVFGRERGVILAIGGAILLGALGYETRNAMRHWRNSKSLYQHTLSVTKENWVMHHNLGMMQIEDREVSEAVANFRKAVEIRPDFAESHMMLADIDIRSGQVQKGIAAYKEAMKVAPENHALLNNLAWLLATQADPTLREPEEALRLAKRANELTDGNDMGVLDTLAAAYAAVGQFDEAIAAAEKAYAIAKARHEDQFAEVIRQRIAKFRAGQPILEGVR